MQGVSSLDDAHSKVTVFGLMPAAACGLTGTKADKGLPNRMVFACDLKLFLQTEKGCFKMFFIRYFHLYFLKEDV